MTLSKQRNSVETQEIVADTIGDGSQTVTTAGTRVQLTSTVTPCRLVNIFAKAGNTGNIFVGGSTVSSTRGMVLEQARSTDWFPIDDLSKIYIDAAISSDGVQYAYVV